MRARPAGVVVAAIAFGFVALSFPTTEALAFAGLIESVDSAADVTLPQSEPDSPDRSASPESEDFLESQEPPESPESLGSLARTELPKVIRLVVDEATDLSLPPGAIHAVGDDSIAFDAPVPSGVRVTGRAPGSTMLFVMTGSESRAVVVRVAPRMKERPKRAERRYDARALELDRRLRVSTGGLVRRGTLGLTHSRIGDLDRSEGRIELRGSAGDASYSFLARTAGPLGVIGTSEASTMLTHWNRLTIDSPHFNLRAGQMALGTEFAPSALSRGAEAVVRAGDWRVEGGLRGPYDRRDVLFDPTAARLRLAYVREDVFELGGGTVLSLDGKGALPFVGGSVSLGRVSASVNAGLLAASETGLAGVFATRLAYTHGACRGELQWVARRGDSEASLAPFVTDSADSLRLHARCPVGNSVFRLWGRLDERLGSGLLAGAAVDRPRDVIPWGVRMLTMGMGDRQRHLVSARAMRDLGDVRLRLDAQGTFAKPAPYFSELLSARWQPSSVGGWVGAGTIHGLDGLHALRFLAGPMWRDSRYGVDFSLQGELQYAPAHTDKPFTFISAQGSWSPVPAWRFVVVARMDPLAPERSLLRAGIAWNFGDELPREPLLKPFRSNVLRVHVFNDLNGDGKRGAGEEPLADVRVCVRTRCELTGADGLVVLRGLEEGDHDVVVEPDSIEGGAATTSPVARVLVGGYRAAEATFGVRRQGQLTIRAFRDDNDNGKRDLNEPAFPGALIRVSGIDGVQEVLLDRTGSATLSVDTLGEVAVSLDLLSLPAGYLPGDDAVRTIRFDSWANREAEFPVRVLRSVAGRACIDADGDGQCGRQDQPLSRVRLTAAGKVTETATDGRFLFSSLPPGIHRIDVVVADSPGGFVLSDPPLVELPSQPRHVDGFSLALRRRTAADDYLASDSDTRGLIRVDGYRLGSRARGDWGFVVALSDGEDAALRRVAGQMRRADEFLLVRAIRDRSVDEADGVERARDEAHAVIRWLASRMGVPLSRIALEVVEGDEAGVEVVTFRRVAGN